MSSQEASRTLVSKNIVPCNDTIVPTTNLSVGKLDVSYDPSIPTTLAARTTGLSVQIIALLAATLRAVKANKSILIG
jgi:hypothetical protein